MQLDADLMRAQHFIDSGQYEAARPMVASRLAANPDDYAGLILMSVIELNTVHTDRAISLAERAAALYPNEAHPWSLISVGQLRLGNATQSRAAAVRRVQLEPAEWGAHALVSEIFDETAGRAVKRDETGLRAANEAVRLAPNEPDAHVVLGNALLRRKKRRDADAAFGRALAIDPMNAAARNSRAVNSLGRNPAQAAMTFASLSAESPGDDLAVHNLRAALGKIVSISWVIVLIAAQISFRTISALGRHPDATELTAAGRPVLIAVAIAVVLVIAILTVVVLSAFGSRLRSLLAFVLQTDRLLAAICAILATDVLLMVAAAAAPPQTWTTIMIANGVVWVTGVVLWFVRRRRMRRDLNALN